MFRSVRPLKLALSCEVVEKNCFCPRFVGEGIPQSAAYIFKSHLLPTMLPISVELGGYLTKKKKKEESVVKPKSANKYVGRPNNNGTCARVANERTSDVYRLH